jgi:RNA polymerase sigma factor (sigma-70 family)
MSDFHPDPNPPRMSEHSSNASFPDTQWSVVLRAAQGEEGTAKAALADLYRSYWYPLYAFARRSEKQAVDAEDLVQDFFVELNGKNVWADADPLRGRLRTFLLVCFRRWMTQAYRRDHTQRRGGHAQHLPLDTTGAEARYGQEPADRRTPETIFHQYWAREVLDGAMARLGRERAALDKSAEFEVLKQFLSLHLPTTDSYLEAARRLGVSENVVAVSVFRLRRRYRELARKAVADTLSSATEDEIEAEWQDLLRVLGEYKGD